MPLSGITVVVMATGSGAKLYPLAEEVPKAMLPVANRPLLSFQLEMLERAGVRQAVVVVPAAHHVRLQTFANTVYQGKLALDWLVLKGDSSESTSSSSAAVAAAAASTADSGSVSSSVQGTKGSGNGWGTAEVLKRLRDRVRGDVLVVSCDSLVDPTALHALVLLHRSRCSSATMLLARRRRSDPSAQQTATSTTSMDEEPRVVGLDETTGRVLCLASPEKAVRISKRLLASDAAGGKVTLHADFNDVHVYVLSRWVLDLIATHDDTSPALISLKSDLIPYLVKAQFSAAEQDELPATAAPATEPLCRTMTHANRRCGSPVSCFALVVDAATTLCMRANTLAGYLEANREIARGSAIYTPWEALDRNRFVSVTAVVDQQTQVGPECVVGDMTHVGGRCALRRVVIGKSCTIGANAKITNSVIMDNVAIGEGATVSDSVVCSRSEVRPKVVVKDSRIGIACDVTEDATSESRCRQSE